jgi:hypothetical protein
MEAAGISGSVNVQQARQSSQTRLNQAELSSHSEQIEQVAERSESQRQRAFQSAGIGQNVDQLA